MRLVTGVVCGCLGLERNGCDHGAGPNLLDSFDDNPFPGLQARLDQPLIADGPVNADHARIDLIGFIHNQDQRSTFGITGYGLLGNEDALLVDAFLDDRPDEHARQQQVVRVGNDKCVE